MHKIEELFGLGKNPTRQEYADEFISVNKLLKELEDYREHLKGHILQFVQSNKSKSVSGELGIIHLQTGSQKRLDTEKARETLSEKVFNSLLRESSYNSLRVTGGPKAKKYPWS